MSTTAQREAEQYESAVNLDLEAMAKQLRAIARIYLTTYTFADRSKLVVEIYHDRETNELKLVRRLKVFDYTPFRGSSASAEMRDKINER